MQKCPLQGYFTDLSITQLAQQLRLGKLSAVQITLASLNCIDQFNHKVNAFCYVDREAAIRQAEYVDQQFSQGIDLGLLHGIPVAVKDNIETESLITTMGSALFKDYIPTKDAECVKRLRQAGAIIIGKTNTHEFAYGPTGDCSYHTATKNPWDLQKISGGSSCGSAVAVATGMVPIAIGTDTGGSIRIPSSLTGVFGLKPSYARFSMQGVFPLSHTLDHLGIIANSAADIKIVFDLLEEQLVQYEKPKKNEVSIAWLPIEQIIHHYDEDQYQKLKAKLFETFTYRIEEISDDLSLLFSELSFCFTSIQNAEAYTIHHNNLEIHPELFQIEVLERLLSAKQTCVWEYIEAKALRKKLQLEMFEIFKRYDFLIMPTLPIAATDLYQRYLYINHQQINVKTALLSLTSPWNVLGFPVVNIPVSVSELMPLGVQVIATHQNDKYLIDFIMDHF